MLLYLSICFLWKRANVEIGAKLILWSDFHIWTFAIWTKQKLHIIMRFMYYSLVVIFVPGLYNPNGYIKLWHRQAHCRMQPFLLTNYAPCLGAARVSWMKVTGCLAPLMFLQHVAPQTHKLRIIQKHLFQSFCGASLWHIHYRHMGRVSF